MDNKEKFLTEIINAMNAVSLHQCNRSEIRKPLEFTNHPLTCGVNSSHGNLYPVCENGRVMLICPDCSYTQGNAGIFSVKDRDRPRDLQ